MKAESKAEQEILAVLNEFDKAFREQDLHRMMKLFVDDEAIFVGAESGAEARGIQQIRSFFESFFSEPFVFGFDWQKVNIDVIGEVAWLFSNCHIEVISAAGRHHHPYRVTAIFQRVGSQWRWLHYHGSEPAG